jgi:phospholipase C
VQVLVNTILLLFFVTLVLLLTASFTILISATIANASSTSSSTPIKHLVVIYQENISFDHYFGTYPHAANPPGQPKFSPSPNTPSVNNLLSAGLLTHNSNLINPFRLDRSVTLTNDNNHSYASEQRAFDGGRMDRFVENDNVVPNYLSPKKCSNPSKPANFTNPCFNPSQVMGYYDGNTVTALWNYAQHFAMSDNFYQTNFGESIPGHLNLISGQTHGAIPADHPKGYTSNGTVIGDADPVYDNCSFTAQNTFIVPWLKNTSVPVAFRPAVEMTGKNIGDLLNAKNITWGWFSAGFKPTSGNKDNCSSISHDNGRGVITYDYQPSVEPFQFYKSTANPHHLPPVSVEAIGHTDQANHQYDVSDFWNAAESGILPAVSYLKAPTYQQAHAGYSGPLLEQIFLVNTINRIQKIPEWNSTAIIITYDDSDGWYDHVMSPTVSNSSDPKHDALFGPVGLCGHTESDSYQDRCGYGPRIVMLAISPFSKVNYIDHYVTDQTSILRFIEDNWHLGRIGNQSLDAKAGSILNMFDFSQNHRVNKLFINPDKGTIGS